MNASADIPLFDDAKHYETHRYKAWCAWRKTALGEAILAEEWAALRQLIPNQFYRVGVQIGALSADFWTEMNVDVPIHVSPIPDELSSDELLNNSDKKKQGNQLQYLLSQPEALPFAESSVDLAVLPHTLELCDDPLRALREMSQILVPEGMLAVTGFNPLSLWGAKAAVLRWRSKAPWAGSYFRVKTLQEWLSLLGLELVAGKMFEYRPPLNQPAWRERSGFLENMGDRWWPGLGGVYVLVMKKQVYGKTPKPNAPLRISRWLGALNPAPIGKAGAGKTGVARLGKF